ncbi:hypothetical protein [Luteitalea sp.]|uniref:hypothetical protein n=1 Tax=Luteitalea sp. TaxID=2004800 RepID=UPI0025C596EE|nr:hypothetical protein [Luteitalea sp.]
MLVDMHECRRQGTSATAHQMTHLGVATRAAGMLQGSGVFTAETLPWSLTTP